jgi:hypothetical protein
MKDLSQYVSVNRLLDNIRHVSYNTYDQRVLVKMGDASTFVVVQLNGEWSKVFKARSAAFQGRSRILRVDSEGALE